MRDMGLQEAAESLLALFSGAADQKARKGALLLGAVLLRHRPELPKIILDVTEETE